jgi:hypothetical protein
MWMRRAAALFFICALMASLTKASGALAATPQVSDLTDFITRLGGYLYSTTGSSEQELY